MVTEAFKAVSSEPDTKSWTNRSSPPHVRDAAGRVGICWWECCCWAASGCGLEEARDGAASPILGDGVSDEIDALEVVDPLIREKLDDCVDYGQLQAFAGDPEWQRVWQDSGQTVAGYRRYCERLANNEPDKFRAIHLEWEAFKTSAS